LNPCGFCFAEAHMVHFTTSCRFHICIRGKHFIISSSVTCQSKQPAIFQVNKSPLNENSRENYVTNCSSHYVCWQFVAARTRKLWWEKLMTTSTVVLKQTRWQFKRKLSVCFNTRTSWSTFITVHSSYVSPKWILQDKMLQILRVQVQSIIDISSIIYTRRAGTSRETESELRLG
jgi:hypothetical protein